MNTPGHRLGNPRRLTDGGRYAYTAPCECGVDMNARTLPELWRDVHPFHLKIVRRLAILNHPSGRADS